MNYDELKFYGQGIHHAKTKEIVFFELLLRKEDNKNIFPKDSYLSMISPVSYTHLTLPTN